MTHGLPFLGRDSWERNVIPGWSRDFDAWAADALAAGRIDVLADFRHAPGMPYAHPTVEHYTPIFVTFRCRDRSVGATEGCNRRFPDGSRQAVIPGRLAPQVILRSRP